MATSIPFRLFALSIQLFLNFLDDLDLNLEYDVLLMVICVILQLQFISSSFRVTDVVLVHLILVSCVKFVVRHLVTYVLSFTPFIFDQFVKNLLQSEPVILLLHVDRFSTNFVPDVHDHHQHWVIRHFGSQVVFKCEAPQ